jgi:transitional endoplasmic reticulum ATPase
MADKSQPSFSLVNCTIHNLESNPIPSRSTPNKTARKNVDASLAKVHHAFKKFYAAPRATNPRGWAHSIIADHHPNHHLINVDQAHFDFSEFAAAGHATEELELEDNSIDVGREYEAPYGGRTYGQEAEVSEKVYWGRFKYSWQGKEFILYKVSWKYEYDQDTMWSFVLYPRAAGEELKAKSEHIDDLLLAIGRYSSMPHADIFVFADDWTYRSKSMYHSIKNAHWDDVILDPGMKDALMKDVISFFQPATKDIYTRYNLPYKVSWTFNNRHMYTNHE